MDLVGIPPIYRLIATVSTKWYKIFHIRFDIADKKSRASGSIYPQSSI